jgi:ATP-binding cassette subfamily B protein
LYSQKANALRRKLATLYAQLPYLPQAFALVWAVAPRWTMAWVVLLVVQGLLPAASVYLTRAVVDSLVLALESAVAIQSALILVLLMVALTLLTIVLGSLSSWINTGQSELVQDHISGLIHKQASTLDLGFYERPEYYDRLHRARVDAASQPLALLKNLGRLLQHSITMVAMAGVLLPFGAWIPLLLLVSTLPAFVIILQHTRRLNAWRLRTTHDKRRSHYYEYLLTYPGPAAEMRLYELGEHFQQAYQTIRQRLRGEHLELIRNKAVAQLLAGSLALLGTGMAMGWMFWQTVQGKATLGDLALFYQAFKHGQSLASSLLGSLGQIYHNILFMENLFDFLEIEPQVATPSQPQPIPSPKRGVTFHQVTFCYPGSEQEALKNFNLHLPAGKIIAIVGVNGAGKSTLVKLLARFYDPQTGHITLDGIDLRHLALSDLRRQITIMFQHPVQYATTAAQNIALSDLQANPTPTQIENAARAAGADLPINRLPESYDSILGKRFGGAELSGGEWQRVALARAFLRQASIIILDEPTSAMDSWAEADWMARFRDLTAERTSIIITHRFTTAMQADIIHVMMAGQIVESGNHQELLALGGRYAQSWRAQMGSTTLYM